MSDPRLSTTVANERVRDLRRAACESRLVAEATCCREHGLRPVLRRVVRR
ncbi:MAG: hypothetical protein ACTHNT_04705 [Actinomycetales bacterium]